VSLVLRDYKHLYTSARFRGCSMDRKHSPQNMLRRICICPFSISGSTGGEKPTIIIIIIYKRFRFVVPLFTKSKRIKRKKHKKKKKCNRNIVPVNQRCTCARLGQSVQ